MTPPMAQTMTQTISTDELEKLAAQLHEVYMQEARRQGDVRHHERYRNLPENTKDFDRALARWIIANYEPRPLPE